VTADFNNEIKESFLWTCLRAEELQKMMVIKVNAAHQFSI